MNPVSTALLLWLPMCFLFDPSADEKRANEKIREMVKAYATCGIELKPFAYTVRPNYPNDPEQIIEASRVACPIPTVFGVRGAIQLELAHRELPKKMCGDDNANGCSTLCSPLSVSFTAQNAGPQVAIHESMHSNCCGPLCVDEGQGAGTAGGFSVELANREAIVSEREASTLKVGSIHSEISPEGCHALRAGASRNEVPNRWNASNDTYYTVEKRPERQLDLMGGRSFFQGPPRKEESRKPVNVSALENLLKAIHPAPTRGIAAMPTEPTNSANASVPYEIEEESPRPQVPLLEATGVRSPPGSTLRPYGGGGIFRIDVYGGAEGYSE